MRNSKTSRLFKTLKLSDVTKPILVNPKFYGKFTEKNYKAYLSTPEWQIKRQKILKRDNYKCRICGSTDKLNVHHLTYDRLGRERMSDLMTLCENCHLKIHKNRQKLSRKSLLKPKE